MKAFVVDDSRATRLHLGRMLREMGFEVEEAEDGVDALQKLERAEPPEIIMVDWYMPNMDGLELVKRLREDSRFNGTQAMMVTTETGQDRIAVALEAGANEYVMKPFSKEMLIEKLEILGIYQPEMG